MQFCRLHVMVSRVPVSVSKVCVMRRLFVLVGLVIFRCFVEMVSRFLMVMSGVMIMFPSLRHESPLLNAVLTCTSLRADSRHSVTNQSFVDHSLG
jgi:hypothetical protein